MERAFLHKSKTAGFGNIEARRTETFATLRNARHSRRAQDFNRHRKISDVLDPVPEPVQANASRQQKELERRNALKKYLEQKEAKKAAVKHKQRPPFVVGIPHHGSSPVLRDLSNKDIKDKKGPCKNETNKEEVRFIGNRVTRASTKVGGRKAQEPKEGSKGPNSKNKVAKTRSPIKIFPFVKSKALFSYLHSTKPLTEPHTPEVLKRSTQKNIRLNNLVGVQPNKKVLFCKTNTRKRDQTANSQAINEHTVNDDPETQESVIDQPSADQLTVIKPQNPEAFKQRERVQAETAELLELADTWHQVTLIENLSQDLVDEIDSLVGQTRLLTRDKFQQFVRIIDEFENPLPNAPIVSIDDLEGFWDMVYLQVSSLKKRYTKLEELKTNNWEVQKSPPKRKRVKRVKRGPNASKSEVTKLMPRRSSRYKHTFGDALPSASSASQLDQPSILLGNEQTPRKSLHLVSQTPTSLLTKACIHCDSPDCKNTGCRVATSSSGNRSKPVLAKKFVLKPSTLTVPETVNSETDSHHKGRKSRRLQINDQNNETAVAEHTPRTRSSRKITHNDGCRVATSSSGNRSKPVLAKKFVLKPSTLTVPETVNSETDSHHKGRKSRRLQINDKNNETAVTGHTPRTRSSRKVTIYADEEEKKSMKLPVTPYFKSRKTTSRTMSDSDS